MADTEARRLVLSNGGLITTILFWGALVPVTHTLLADYDALFQAFVRYLIAMPFLVAFLLLRDRRFLPAQAPDWRRVMLLGAGMAGFATCYTLGISFSDPVTAAIFLTTGPVIANLMARAMYGSRFPPGMALALLLVVGGAVLVVHGNPQNAGRTLSLQGGEILMVLAQASWIWYSLKVTEWRPAADAVRATTLTSIAASLWLGVVYGLVALTGVLPVYFNVPTVETGAMLLLAGAGAAGIAVVLWNYGSSVMGVPLASLYLNLVPVVAVVLSVAMGSDTSLEQLSGGLLVILGVLQVQVRRLRLSAST